MNRILVYGLSQDTLGGIETFLLNMNRFMSDETIFDYVIEGDHTIHQSEINKKGGKCFYISPKKKVFANLRDWKKLLKEQKDNYRIVYFNLYSLAWIFPITIALKQGYKVIVHAHNNKLHNCGIIQKTLHVLNRQYQKHLKIVRFTNSELSSRFFFGNKKAELIYNAINVDQFKFDEEKRNRIRRELAISENETLYGFSGRVSYQKNPLFLIDIFHEISKIDSNARFIICGDGNLKKKTEEKALALGLDVLFIGSVKNIEDYYQAMDCFVLPSRFEGLGIVLIEAQSSGLPSFTSKNVVPQIAKITNLLEYLPLESGAKFWADFIVNKSHKHLPRNESFSLVFDSNYNILIESSRIEQIFNNILSND